MDCLKKAETDKSNGLSSVNLTLQFLFFELRYSNQVRKWFDRKLSMELDELLSKTTIGKFFSKLSVSYIKLKSINTQFTGNYHRQFMFWFYCR